MVGGVPPGPFSPPVPRRASGRRGGGTCYTVPPVPLLTAPLLGKIIMGGLRVRRARARGAHEWLTEPQVPPLHVPAVHVSVGFPEMDPSRHTRGHPQRAVPGLWDPAVSFPHPTRRGPGPAPAWQGGVQRPLSAGVPDVHGAVGDRDGEGDEFGAEGRWGAARGGPAHPSDPTVSDRGTSPLLAAAASAARRGRMVGAAWADDTWAEEDLTGLNAEGEAWRSAPLRQRRPQRFCGLCQRGLLRPDAPEVGSVEPLSGIAGAGRGVRPRAETSAEAVDGSHPIVCRYMEISSAPP